VRQPALATLAFGDQQRCRAPLPEPAAGNRLVGTERADVDPVGPTRRIPGRPLPEQERSVADPAGAQDVDLLDDHAFASSFAFFVSSISFWAMWEGTSS
jgi:hypothetical protein